MRVFFSRTRKFGILFFAAILSCPFSVWCAFVLIIGMTGQEHVYASYSAEFKEKVVLEYKKGEKGREYQRRSLEAPWRRERVLFGPGSEGRVSETIRGS
jgi:hypothetical protein